MNNLSHLIVTVVIWGIVGGVLITAGLTGADMVPLAVILGIGATISTARIWHDANNSHSETAQATKAKRTDRISRLVNQLDDDEVYTLEELLTARREDRTLEHD